MNVLLKSWAFLAILAFNLVLSASVSKRDASLEELENIQQALESEAAFAQYDGQNTTNDRDKRLALIKKIGIKAVLLNFIFGKIDGHLDAKIRLINQLDKQNAIKNEKYFGIPPPNPPSYNAGRRNRTTTEATITFQASSPVALVIPDRLYGNSFGLLTNISQTIGDVLFNTAARAQEFSDQLSNKVRRKFGFANDLLGSGSSPKASPTAKN